MERWTALSGDVAVQPKAGVTGPVAHGLDRDARVDQLGGVGVPELVDVDASRVAAVGPAVVGDVVGQVLALVW